ncbi:MAG: hypothetical protein ABH885_06620 [Candidatus Omnitrophota bacterium]
MLRLDLSVALFVYLSVSVVAVLVLWIVCGYRSGVRDKRAARDEDYIWHCNICAHVYIDSRDNVISKCPQCGSFISRSGDIPDKDSAAA